jgi:hypothetical protein
MDPSPQRASAAGHVSFAGCPSGWGSVLRIGLAEDTDRRPTKAIITACPACGTEHVATLFWRRLGDGDAGREPDLVVDAEGRQS